MAVAIVFETHSLTIDNEAGVATGWSDGQLSDRGRALAADLGRRRGHDGIAEVFASDLGRAAETVELAFGGSAIPVHLDARLPEVDYGALNGCPSPGWRARGHSGSAGPSPAARATSRWWLVIGWQEGWSYALPTGWRQPGRPPGP